MIRIDQDHGMAAMADEIWMQLNVDLLLLSAHF